MSKCAIITAKAPYLYVAKEVETGNCTMEKCQMKAV